MKKILIRGPALTGTGYGEHCRFILRSLRTIEDKVDIYLLPVNWGKSSWIWTDDEERQWIDQLVKKTAQYTQQNGQFDISIQITIPNEWQQLAPVNIGITAGIETTKVAPVWIEKLNEMDKVITISNHSKQTFLQTAYSGVDKQTNQPVKLQCNKDIEVIHYPIKTFEEAEIDLNLDTKFNFLAVAQWGPRKNIGNTIIWFVEEFIDNPNVGLIVKTFIKGGSLIDKIYLEKQLRNLLKKYKNRQCKVYLLHGDLTEKEIHSLYKKEEIKALVSLSHGEGFGLPMFEAAYSGLPVIAPDWSGYVDFLYKPHKDKKGREKLKAHFVRVEYDLKPVQEEAHWEGVIQPDSMWCFAQQGSYKMRLREVVKDYGRFNKQAKDLQKYLLKHFTFENQSKKVVDQIISQDEFEISEWLNELEKEIQVN